MLRTLVMLVLFLTLFAPSALARVVVHDALAVEGEPLMLRAETRGRFFRKGGEVVTFSVDGTSLGQALSGGDGMAFREFYPKKTGLYTVKAASRSGDDTGHVLVLKRGRGIVFVDVAGALFRGFFPDEPREGGLEAMRNLEGKCYLVYLRAGLLGRGDMKAWLSEKGFPEAPLLDWGGGKVLESADKKGLKIKAVIGTAEVVESARKYGARTFSFGGPGDQKSWEDIADVLCE